MVFCEVCGFGYAEDEKEDVIDHNIYHQNFLMLQEKYGADYIMKSKVEEAIKLTGHNLHNADYPLAIRLSGAKLCLKSWFSRSAISYGSEHPSFEEYVAMRLKQNIDQLPNLLPFTDDILEHLISQYGLKEGMDQHCYSYYQN
ncbi:hypothetical protein [Priestia aryabhattai]